MGYNLRFIGQDNVREILKEKAENKSEQCFGNQKLRLSSGPAGQNTAEIDPYLLPQDKGGKGRNLMYSFL